MTPTRTIAVPSSPVDDDSAVTARSASVAGASPYEKALTHSSTRIESGSGRKPLARKTCATLNEPVSTSRANVDSRSSPVATHSESPESTNVLSSSTPGSSMAIGGSGSAISIATSELASPPGAGIAVVDISIIPCWYCRKYASASMAQRSAGSTAVLGTSEVDASGGGHRSVLPATGLARARPPATARLGRNVGRKRLNMRL